MNINYFEMFHLPEDINIDEEKLEHEYLKLIHQYHPDRYADKSSFEQKQISIISSAINDGYQILKTPLKRIIYILELQGVIFDAEKKTSFPTDFLTKQLEWHESLDESNTIEDVDTLEKIITNYQTELTNNIGQSLSSKKLEDAKENTYKLMFTNKIMQEVENKKNLFNTSK